MSATTPAMMLRVEWQEGSHKFSGTVVGYVGVPSSYGEPKAIVLTDPHSARGTRRQIVSKPINQLEPAGWRREIEIT